MSDIEKLRRLATYLRDNRSGLYSLRWKAVQLSDEFGVCPRVYIGGKFSSYIKLGCWNEDEGQVMQRLAEYIAILDPMMALELLDNGN